MSENKDHEDTFRILLATDSHLGYMEHDAVRAADSFTTFEEILQIAEKKKVDFVLLGGDLFHDNKPSRKTLHQCISLLRKYCMGDRPVQFQFLSDQSENFKHSNFPHINYEDPNLNIGLPIFSIHGNHDDPAGSGSLCSLDLLSTSGFINYFGKCVDLEKVQISPLLLQKGSTKLALFGLGSIRDERLHRLFREGRVSMLRPKEDAEEWFNLLTLHQNRAKHGQTNYIPEQFLDSFLDLVVWGHEHECRLSEEWNGQQNFYVTQPGSSVATSLCYGEAVPKQVGLLEINKKNFKITEIPLETVRQFYIKDIDLDEISLDLDDAHDASEKAADYFKEIIEGFIQKSLAERSGHQKQPDKPLIRLRIFHSDKFAAFSVRRFGQAYVDRVANPKDILHFSRKKVKKDKTSVMDSDALKTVLQQQGIDKSRVEDLVKQYFQVAEDKNKLALLSENGIGNAIQEYVVKEVNEAISVLVTHQLKKVQTHLQDRQIDDNNIKEEILQFKAERQQKSSNQELTEYQEALKNHSKRSSGSSSNVDNSFFDDDDEVSLEVAPKTRGRGRGRGARGQRRGATNGTAAKSRASTRTSRQTKINASWQSTRRESSDDDSDIEAVDVFTRPSKRPRTAASSRKGVVYADF